MSLKHWFRGRLRERLLRGEVPLWLQVHPRRRYYIAAVLSVPGWADRAALLKLQRQRDWMTVATGIEHVLDHLVPLNHPHVCGLTVPANLLVVPREVNAAKSNHWWPDHWLEQMVLDL